MRWPPKQKHQPGYEQASDRRRASARLLDMLGFALVEYLVISAVLAGVVVEAESMTAARTSFAVLLLVIGFLLTAYVYYLLPVLRFRKTTGMALLKLEALPVEGAKPTHAQGLRLTLRWLVGDQVFPFWWGEGTPKGVDIVRNDDTHGRIRVSGRRPPKR